ncbi:hypothetical protein Pelo_9954 [Pelomyxa schiedti]|nr:hypothetical protein Pelo_9954 [Pelomyxa schiedti]
MFSPPTTSRPSPEQEILAKDIDAVVKRVRDPKVGMEVSVRTVNSQSFQHCFYGSDLLNFMVTRCGKTMEESRAIAVILLDRSYFYDLCESTTFEENSVYCFHDFRDLSPSQLEKILTILRDPITGVTSARSGKAVVKSFSGAQAVDCLVTYARAHVTSRQEAVYVCQELMNRGYISYVNSKNGFKDNKDLFSLNESGFIHTGFLMKKGNFNHDYKTRWFCLKEPNERKLWYFTNPYQIHPIKFIPLERGAVQISKSQRNCFEIATLNRVYYLQAKSTKVMWEWIQAITPSLQKVCSDNDAIKRADGDIRIYERAKNEALQEKIRQRRNNFDASVHLPVDKPPIPCCVTDCSASLETFSTIESTPIQLSLPLVFSTLMPETGAVEAMLPTTDNMWIGCRCGSLLVFNLDLVARSIATTTALRTPTGVTGALVKVFTEHQPHRICSVVEVEVHEVWSSDDSGTICVWDRSNLCMSAKMSVSESISRVLPHDSSTILQPGPASLVYCVHEPGTVALYSAKTRQRVGSVEIGGQHMVHFMTGSINGDMWFAMRNVLYLQPHTTGKVIHLPPQPSHITCLVTVNDKVWGGTAAGDICLWSVKQGESPSATVVSQRVHSARVDSIIHIGEFIVTSSFDRTVALWSCEPPELDGSTSDHEPEQQTSTPTISSATGTITPYPKGLYTLEDVHCTAIAHTIPSDGTVWLWLACSNHTLVIHSINCKTSPPPICQQHADTPVNPIKAAEESSTAVPSKELTTQQQNPTDETPPVDKHPTPPKSDP